MKTGLTLGKYAPLHKGHQLVIETALREVDRLVVLIYDSPEVTDVPLAVRTGWLRTLYPQVEVIEAVGGPAEVGDTSELRVLHERFILELLGTRRITHFYSSEFYGAHVSAALGAVDRRVDPERARAAISGSAIRADAFAHRAFLHPSVYWSLLHKVVFLGAPSTGKSTLAAACAQRFGTTWVPEYGREYWEQHQVDRRLTPEQLVEIAEGHRERELLAAADAHSYLFIDTDASTTAAFANHYHDGVRPRLRDYVQECASRYDTFFLCDTDIPYDDTWDRSGDVRRTEFQRAIRDDLEHRGINFHILRGNLADRLGQVAALLPAPNC